MWLKNSVLFYVFNIFVLVYCKKLPPFVEICPRHPQIGDCLKKNIEIIRQHFCKGVPSIFIPSFNPLKIPQATLEGANEFKITFNDISIYGAENVVIEELNFDTTKWYVKLKVFFPVLRMKSYYKVKGRILVLQLDGQGPANGNFTDVRASITGQLTPFEKNGKTHLKGKEDSFSLELGKPQLQFDNLFGDNEELNKQTNAIVNENGLVIIEELKPVIKQVVIKFVFGIIDNLFQTYSIDELFPLP